MTRTFGTLGTGLSALQYRHVGLDVASGSIAIERTVSNPQRGMSCLADAQIAISSGWLITKPSDDPAGISPATDHADLAAASLELSSAQVAYQASMAATARAIQPSLASFLR